MATLLTCSAIIIWGQSATEDSTVATTIAMLVHAALSFVATALLLRS
ncbi:hypothetical protein [Dietzia sp.]